MTAAWLEVRVRPVAPRTHDAVVHALVAAGAPGIHELEGELRTHLPDGADPSLLARAVAALDPAADVTWARVGAVDLTPAWQARVGVQRVGRVAVAPPWRAAEITGAECPVIIEPALAFGTGEHETTRGMLRLMQDIVRTGDFVADVGAGSAVLSIAAARLGAERIAAIELDPLAIGNAEENIERNGVGDRVRVIEGDGAVVLPLLAPVRVVLANIVSSVLLALEPVLRAALAPDGAAVLGGILTSERAHVSNAFAARWRLVAELTEGEWWSCAIVPR